MTLLQFTFGNFRSFRKTATLSLVAASKLQEDPDLDKGNVFPVHERPFLKLLHVAAIYGANASGKSNVVRAISGFKRCVMESANVGFHYSPAYFRLDTTSHEQPTFFEITFLRDTEEHSSVQYRYGFEIQKVKGADKADITAEWLYEARTTTEALLFEREGTVVKHGRHFGEGKALLTDKRLGRADALFLSLLAQIGSPVASALVAYLRTGIKVVAGINDEGLRDFTMRCLEEEKHCNLIQSLIREADTGIPSVKITEEDDEMQIEFPERLSEQLRERISREVRKKLRVVAEHPVFDPQGIQVGVEDFSMTSEESQGTQKLFAYSGPILDTLERGNTLIVDEMDARFHPLLTQALVRLFQAPETNPHNAQMVFITHDTNLLNSRRLRRDQICFVEKDRYGASHMYALSDFKGVRKGDLFEEQYIQGRYGAIPFLGGLDNLFAPEPIADETVEDAHAAA